jgi:hypothetical protein
MKNLFLFIKSLFIYFEIYKPKYNFCQKIDFGSSISNKYFKKKLKKSKLYFEYGSGNSTLYANKIKKNYISIEGKKDIYLNLRFKKKLNVYLFDLGVTKKFSIPYFIKFKKKRIKAYAKAISKFHLNPDLILIDGRFRVLCFFYIINYLKLNYLKKCEIIFDDFNRAEYSIINNYFKVKKIGRLGIIKLINQKKIFSIKKIENKFLSTYA